jgi:hypothetical protein
MLMVSVVYSSSADLKITFEDSSVKYTYTFTFESLEEIPNSFSFEKTSDAKIITAVDGEGNFLKPKIAGDYLIIDTKNSNSQEYVIEFESLEKYIELNQKNSFSTYVNLNAPVDFFKISISVPENRETINIIPRDYTLLDDNTLEWEFDKISKDMFFLLEFKPLPSPSQSSENLIEKYSTIFFSLFFLVFVLVIYLLRIFFLQFKKKGVVEKVVSLNNEEENKESTDERSSEEKTTPVDPEISYKVVVEDTPSETPIAEDKIEGVDNKSLEEKREAYIEKYLTENEKEVVRVVLKYDGIVQNEILQYLPSLTKSNLSKIITKLHGKRILNRVRVGKINRIYVGEQLDFKEEHSDTKKE